MKLKITLFSVDYEKATPTQQPIKIDIWSRLAPIVTVIAGATRIVTFIYNFWPILESFIGKSL